MPDPMRSSPACPESRLRIVGWIVVAWLILGTFSFIRVPIPAVNEPHYLSKARHFWNPQWCAGDQFLDSSNPHAAFYATIGWLTTVCSLTQAALAGRVIGLAVVAWGWQKLGRSLTGSSRLSLLALCFLLVLQSLGNWSGEWLIGGIESKVIAYGCLFYALGAGLQGERFAAAATLGLSITFHPLIGVWGLLCATAAVTVSAILQLFRPVTWDILPIPRSHKIVAALLLVTCALPGLLPAWTVIQDATPATSLRADYLQFAGRLAHHLDPLAFPKESHRYFSMQLLLLAALLTGLKPFHAERWLTWKWFVCWSLLVALAGLLLAAGPRPVKLMPGWEWRIRLLKFYPFRLADMIVPAAICLSIVQRFPQIFGSTAAKPRQLTILLKTASVASLLLCVAIIIPGPDKNPSRFSSARLSDWQLALDWINQQTPPEAIIYSQDEHWAVKWYAQRAEYVNFKDCPQDAASMIDWNHRLWTISTWRRATYSDGLSTPREFSDLHSQTGINYLILKRPSRTQATSVYENRHYAIYKLAPDHPE